MHGDCNNEAVPLDVPTTQAVATVIVRIKIIKVTTTIIIKNKNNINSVSQMLREQAMAVVVVASYVYIVA